MGESRMRAICTSGLMSGDWKRTYGANCDTGVSESGRKQSSLTTYGNGASRRLYPSRGISTPSLLAQGEQRRLFYFNIQRDNSQFSFSPSYLRVSPLRTTKWRRTSTLRQWPYWQ